MDRRDFVRSSMMVALSTSCLAATGCRSRPKQLISIAAGGSLAEPLIIDTHAHVFNASDLQVSGFVSRVAANEIDSSAIRFLARSFAPVLQLISWGLSPSADAESRILSRYIGETEDQVTEAAASDIQEIRESQYAIARAELDRAARQAIGNLNQEIESFSDPIDNLAPDDQALGSLMQLPARYDQLFSDEMESGFLSDAAKKINAARKFLVEMFQHRHVSAINYFNTYKDGNTVVDLVTPCMVDFDWWLGSGKSTHSSISEQIQVNELIAALSGGRIHPFVPFDPLRQVIWQLNGENGESPMGQAINAIENSGFIGIKMYPPMGFAIYQNSSFSNDASSVWRGKNWLPEITQSARFGTQLDEALDRLYEYCSANDVPVMAHSSRSNMTDKEFEQLLMVDSWQRLYEKYDLIGSFGHFSGLGSGADSDHWQGFVDLLKGDASSPNPRRYADASYFAQTLSDSDNLVDRLQDVLFDDDGNPSSAFDKLMYGSDWKMLLMEVGSQHYMTEMIDILKKADTAIEAAGFTSELQSQVMGKNGASYLGLHSGMRTRQRLERFYEAHRVREPIWMQKVDA